MTIDGLVRFLILLILGMLAGIVLISWVAEFVDILFKRHDYSKKETYK